MLNWRCGVQVTVWMIWYFINNYSRSHIYQLLGGDLPAPHGSPITKDTISIYIAALTDRVAAVGLRKLLTYQLTGKVQIDETFVRTPRKHNRGRIQRGGRSHSWHLRLPINHSVIFWGARSLGPSTKGTGRHENTRPCWRHHDPFDQVLVCPRHRNSYRCVGWLQFLSKWRISASGCCP